VALQPGRAIGNKSLLRFGLFAAIPNACCDENTPIRVQYSIFFIEFSLIEPSNSSFKIPD
jgi:hypothetical protein